MSLFNNSGLQKIALSTLKSHMEKAGVSCGLFHFDAEGEIQVDFFKEKMVAIPATDLETYRAAFIELQRLEAAAEISEREATNE